MINFFLFYFKDNYDKILRISIFLLSLILIVSFFPNKGKFKYEFSKGKPWLHETLIAPFSFPILKSDEEVSLEIKSIRSIVG